MIMGNLKRIVSALLSVCTLMLVVSSAHAATWESKGKALFEKDEYEQCIRYLDPYKKDKMAMMLLSFCHLQESILTESKQQKSAYASYYERVREKLSLDDINAVYYFISQYDKPVVVEKARRLAGQIFDGVSDIDDLDKLTPFMTVKDSQAQEMVFSTVVRILEPKREYVGDGGTLRSKDVRAMSSESLIIGMLDNVGVSGSRKALTLIEEPVLAYTSNYSGKDIMKLEKKIRSRVAKRQARFPGSNWYSATGKKR